MLSAKQHLLLSTIANEPITAAGAAERAGVSENAARQAFTRLESRGLAVGSGAGSTKTWAPTPSGLAALSEPSGGEDDEDSATRGYVVLEQNTLVAVIDDLVRAGDLPAIPDDLGRALERADLDLYEVVHRTQARNTEHALRQAAKEVYGETTTATLPSHLVAVAERHWHREPVSMQVRQTVTIG